MLIRNDSRIERLVHMKLKYDDDTCKKGTIKTGDHICLSFRRDGEVIADYGVIKDIIESYHYKLSREREESTCLIFDASHKFESRVFTIPLCDIIDFEFMVPKTIGPEKGKIPMKIIEDLRKE